MDVYTKDRWAAVAQKVDQLITSISSLTEQSLTFLMVPEHIMRHAPNAPSYVTLPVYEHPHPSATLRLLRPNTSSVY